MDTFLFFLPLIIPTIFVIISGYWIIMHDVIDPMREEKAKKQKAHSQSG